MIDDLLSHDIYERINREFIILWMRASKKDGRMPSHTHSFAAMSFIHIYARASFSLFVYFAIFIRGEEAKGGWLIEAETHQ